MLNSHKPPYTMSTQESEQILDLTKRLEQVEKTLEPLKPLANALARGLIVDVRKPKKPTISVSHPEHRKAYIPVSTDSDRVECYCVSRMMVYMKYLTDLTLTNGLCVKGQMPELPTVERVTFIWPLGVGNRHYTGNKACVLSVLPNVTSITINHDGHLNDGFDEDVASVLNSLSLTQLRKIYIYGSMEEVLFFLFHSTRKICRFKDLTRLAEYCDENNIELEVNKSVWS